MILVLIWGKKKKNQYDSSEKKTVKETKVVKSALPDNKMSGIQTLALPSKGQKN